MKNKSSRILVLILAFSLCIGILIPLSISAETETQAAATPDIYSQNVQYNEKFSLVYAVDAATVTAPVKLYLYEQNPESGAAAKKVYDNAIHTEANDDTYGTPRESYIFITDGVAAYAMTKEFYVQAVDANGNESAVKKYSVAEYLYERIASGKASPERVAFYTATIELGASAQEVIAEETDTSKYINNYCYVKALDEKTTVNGFANGIYPKGSAITATTLGAEKCTVLTHKSQGYYVRETVNNGASIIIPTDAVAINLFSDNVVVHRAQAESFENFEIGASSYFNGKMGDKNLTNLVVEDGGEGHGKIYSADVPTDVSGSEYLVSGLPSTDIVGADDATALEISCDVRLPNSGTATNNYIDFNIQMEFVSSGTWRTTKFRFEKGTQKLSPSYIGTYSGTEDSTDIAIGEWFHIRVVMYKGDENVYIYLNGSDEYYVGTPDSKYTGDLSVISSMRFETLKRCAGATIEIDNYFYGYTMDKNPNAQK